MLLSYSRHWGTYDNPLNEIKKQFNSLFEVTYAPQQLKGWSFTVSGAMDRGSILGYKNSTKIAKEALETGRSVYELVLEHGILNKEELDTILSPENMLKPVKLDIKPRR